MRKIYGKNSIISRQRFNDIAKEIFRKSIHVCSAFIPFLLKYLYWQVLSALALVTLIYCTAELMRLNGKNVPFISDITAAAARKRDENRFVLGPVTLSVGIMLTALLFNPLPASIGIYSLAFGDGLASLSGKLFGKVVLPFTFGKTVAGSLTCFTAIFISSFLVCHNATVALSLACIGMFIEVLPLKDFDNVVIPLIIAFSAQKLLGAGA